MATDQKLFLDKRQSDIMRVVQEKGSCSIGDLALALDVTTETIRRNLKPLVNEGVVTKFHGGVMLPERIGEPPFQSRMQLNRVAKMRIGNSVAAQIRDGDSLMIDTGSTTACVAHALSVRSNLLVVTNSIEIARHLVTREGNRVFLAGGELRPDDAAAFGSSALGFVRQFKAKVAILSIGGINDQGELTDFHLAEAEFSRALMQQAEQVWVLADQSKFGREAPMKVGTLDDVDVLFTDGNPPQALVELCKNAGVRIDIAETPSD